MKKADATWNGIVSSFLHHATLTFALFLVVAGCDDRAAETEPSVPQSTPTTAAGEVEYEPAYPTDVSAEQLSAEDVEQQRATHTHEGEEDTHDEGEHTHGGDSGHKH